MIGAQRVLSGLTFAVPTFSPSHAMWTSAPPAGVVVPGPATQGTFTGTAGNDNLTGTADPDVFFMGQGGRDRVAGAAGNDQIFFDAAFAANDQIDGGLGTDVVTLEGDYSGVVVFDALSMTNVETLQLAGSFSFDLTLHDATVAAGQTLQIGGGPATVSVDASAETDAAQLRLIGWTGADTFIGGASNDILQGRGNADYLRGGGGDDTYFYNAAAESKGPQYDTIDGFDFRSADLFDVWFAVTGIGERVTKGTLSTSSFDVDMANAIDADALDAHNAVLFRPNRGELDGKMFLVVDANAVAGYQAGGDLVFLIENSPNAGRLNAADFI
jgi:hypothetical protein